MLANTGVANPHYFAFNLSDPLFQDIEVRKALSMAVDADAIIDAVYANAAGITVAVRGYSPLAPERAGHDNEGCKALTSTYDPEAAAAKLEAAGWAKNGDGIYEKDGTPLAFTITVSNSDANKQKAAIVVSTQLKAFGVDCSVQSLENATYMSDTDGGLAQMAIYSGYDGPAASRQIMQSDPGKFNPNNGYANAELDALLAEAWDVTVDETVRNEQIAEATRMFIADNPWLFIYYVYAQCGYSTRVHGIESYPSCEMALCCSTRNVSVD